MPAHSSFDYAIIRVVPRVEREEFINAGVILYCLTRRYLDARVELDERRLAALAPEADVELIRGHLASIPRVCAGGKAAGPIGQLPQKERFHWLVAPRSTMIQTGPVHSGLCQEPEKALEHLLQRMVRR
ncbi:DUF3037 domain-containing protein [Archangium violaceum]|uniref:DUF3037 domain-containing protein n=1 Tax=Archangium violaceum TaxID=83451 RepID=UPI00193B98FB|nr:DUF3037 domain-containing protein [Archangium violaceum]QRK05790.1 DUF3037 domain-containing protein [Archangium violaceum]